VVSHDEWLKARTELLRREKKLTRAHDALNQARRALPWVKLEKDYIFDTTDGPRSLAGLFDGRSQLIVQHFMFGPDWKEGCVGCSFKSDHIDGTLAHLEAHDVSFLSVSRAPLAEIEAFRKRMGWRFRWVSSSANDFNFDFHVSFTQAEAAAGRVHYNYAEQPYNGSEGAGVSVFFKDEQGSVFHTYSAFGRGDETLVTAYMYLDMTPKGRNEHGPNGNLMDWVRHHDRYGTPTKSCGCQEGA
jgi:predicted dithiol-disulfide oxidoreductase (DUF899 family)